MDIKFLEIKLYIVLFCAILFVYFIQVDTKSDKEIKIDTISKLDKINEIRNFFVKNEKIIKKISSHNIGSISKSHNAIHFSLFWLLPKIKDKISKQEYVTLKNMDKEIKLIDISINLNFSYLAFRVNHEFLDSVVTDYYLVFKKPNYNLLPFRDDLLEREVQEIPNNCLYVKESYKYLGW